MATTSGFWTFASEAEAQAGLPYAPSDVGPTRWDRPAQLRDGRWAFAARAGEPLPKGATLITGLEAAMLGFPLRRFRDAD